MVRFLTQPGSSIIKAKESKSRKAGSIVSIADFARHLDLSPWTVSRAINGHPEVNIKTREKILQAMKEIGFSPNPLARGLRGQNTGLVGVSVSGLTSPILNTKIYYLQEFLRKRGLRSLIEFSIRDPENEIRVIQDFLRIRVDGVILIYSDFAAEKARRLLAGIPCVQVDAHGPQSVPSVSLNRSLAMRLLFEHLLELGHRRFALLGFNEEDPWRWPALVAAAGERGLDPRKIFFPFGQAPQADYAVEAGRSMAAEALRFAVRPTAFIAIDDLVALGAIQAVRDAGLGVPEDISVTGFDYLNMIRHVHPTLTTIEQNPLALMEAACQLFVSQLEARDAKAAPLNVEIEPRLILGESTGHAPSEDAAPGRPKRGK